MALLPLLGADLDRPFLPFLVASDAPPEFGFGTSVYACPPTMRRARGQKPRSEGMTSGSRARRATNLSGPAWGGRAIWACGGDFTDALSIRTRAAACSGVLEARQVVFITDSMNDTIDPGAQEIWRLAVRSRPGF